jgi:hypothetical protein
MELVRMDVPNRVALLLLVAQIDEDKHSEDNKYCREDDEEEIGRLKAGASHLIRVARTDASARIIGYTMTLHTYVASQFLS